MNTSIAHTLKPGDLVATPSGRVAMVCALRADGRRELRYQDREGGDVALAPGLLTRIVNSAPVPWTRRVLR